MAGRIDDFEALDKFRMNPIVVLIMLLILLVATGSVRRARRIMKLISREFTGNTATNSRKSFKMLSGDLNNTINKESKPLNYIVRNTKTVKVEGEVAEDPILNSSKYPDLKIESLKFPSEVRDLDDTLMSYIKIKKSRISISECSRDLGIPPSEVKKALVRLHELGIIKLQWSVEHNVGLVQAKYSKTHSNSL